MGETDRQGSKFDWRVDIVKILITGGAGFVGTHLCNYYVKKGYEVTCMDIKEVGTGLIQAHGNILNREDIAGIFHIGCFDAVIHLAAQIRVDRAKELPKETFDINVGGTLNLLDAARKYDVKKFLFASSSEVYGSAQYTPIDEKHPLGSSSIYGASKIAGDRLCHAYSETYGMNIGILRPFNIYGPGQSGGVIPIFINNVKLGRPPVIQGDGSQTRDYVYISDMVSAYDMMLNTKISGAVNFGSGLDTSVSELAGAIIWISGGEMKPEYRDAPPGKTERLVADISRARRMGWHPKVRLIEGLENCIEALP